MPGRRLVVIGDGPERARIEEAARGHTNIQILGYQPEDVLLRHLSKAKAFLFASIEDFGIAPLEAQACGTPVIALAMGGVLETIRPYDSDKPTGIYFSEQSEDSIIAAVERFEDKGHIIKPQDCRSNAERFASEQFRLKLMDIVEAAVKGNSLQHPRCKEFQAESRDFRELNLQPIKTSGLEILNES
jgi:glycosyltransferase involved in cell wall biosynthesis